MEPRVLAAARAVYAVRGWSGFTLDEVAREASVGKGSLYLRWPSKGALLVEAVRASAPAVEDIDLGSLERDLREFAKQWMTFVRSPEGYMVGRLWFDRHLHKDLESVIEEADYPRYVRATRALIRRAIDRGELDDEHSLAVIGDLIAGAVSNHVRSTPAKFETVAHNDAFVEQVVNIVLRGVGVAVMESDLLSKN